MDVEITLFFCINFTLSWKKSQKKGKIELAIDSPRFFGYAINRIGGDSMAGKIYSIDEIRMLVQPIAQHYGVERVSLFGSYARGDATPGSDIDLRIDSGKIREYFKLAGFHRELEEALNLSVDVLTTGALDEKFLNRIREEEVSLYNTGCDSIPALKEYCKMIIEQHHCD